MRSHQLKSTTKRRQQPSSVSFAHISILNFCDTIRASRKTKYTLVQYNQTIKLQAIYKNCMTMPATVKPLLIDLSSSSRHNEDLETKTRKENQKGRHFSLRPPQLLRLFSRHITETDVDVDVDTSSRGRRGILKYKTQEQSLSKPYPKPYICCRSTNTSGRDGEEGVENGKKCVLFSFVTIRSYPTILSDHPCAAEGPAVGLGWTVVEERTLTLETASSYARPSRPFEYHLCRWSRERMLLARGYSPIDLARAEREAKLIRVSRRKNAVSYPSWLYPMVHLFQKQVLVDDWVTTAMNAKQGRGKKERGRREKEYSLRLCSKRNW